jgi:hypothetical protein
VRRTHECTRRTAIVYDDAVRIVVLVTLLASTIAHANVIDPPEPRYGPKGFPGLAHHEDAFLYVGYRQIVGADSQGAGAHMLQGDPAIAIADAHSLGEIGLSSMDGRQIVEIGWHVDVRVNGDAQPRLFVFHWIDGAATCYNACGWVQVSTTNRPGMRIAPGEYADYLIQRQGQDWWLYYNDDALGYFPGSLWTAAGTSYTDVGIAQWFGEIAAASPESCSEMGNGVFGNDPAATTMSELTLVSATGAQVAASADIGTISNPAYYNIGQTTPTSFGFGGPGARVGCCTPETCTDLAADCGQVPDRCGSMRPCGACSTGERCTPAFTCEMAPASDAMEPVEDGGCCEAGGTPSLAPALILLFALRRRDKRRA